MHDSVKRPPVRAASRGGGCRNHMPIGASPPSGRCYQQNDLWYILSKEIGVTAPDPRPAPVSDEVVTRATLRAAARLGLSNKAIARVIGVSEATVSRMGTGTYRLKPADKSFDLALLFVRLFRSLDAITGGDEAVARAWLTNDNEALGGVPGSLIETVSGLVTVVGYLDARRALV